MQIDEPTNFQVFMAEVNKTAKTESIGVYHQVPFRMARWNFARLEGLRNHMGEPRNKVLNSLIEIALDQVYEKMTDEQKAVYEEIQSLTLADTIKSVESGDEKDD